MNSQKFTFDVGEGRSAVHAMEIILPETELEGFIDGLPKFAQHNGLESAVRRFSDPENSKDFILANFWREDVLISCSNSVERLQFKFSIHVDPDKGGTPERAAELVKKMKQFASEFPGVTVEQKW